MNKFKEYISTLVIENAITDTNRKYSHDVEDNTLVIAVMDRGWVFIGFITNLTNGRIRLDCCSNIHQWGTTEGLGQLALNGPLKDTVLNDSTPIVGKPIFLMQVDNEKWLT